MISNFFDGIFIFFIRTVVSSKYLLTLKQLTSQNYKI